VCHVDFQNQANMARVTSKKTVKRGPKATLIAKAIREAMAKCQEAFDMTQGLSDEEESSTQEEVAGNAGEADDKVVDAAKEVAEAPEASA
jgi:hypothetical protein